MRLSDSIRRFGRSSRRILRWLRSLPWRSGLAVPLLAVLRRVWPAHAGEPAFDLVLVTPRGDDSGWILDAICREIGQRQPHLKLCYCGTDEALPPARKYFFSHYMYFFQHLSLARMLQGRQSYVFATHLEPAKHGMSDAAVARLLAYSDGVLCMNSGLQQTLRELGVPAEKLHVAVGGANPGEFQPHARSGTGLVGFCSAYYPRKSPDLIAQIVRRMPWRNFLLVGKGWNAYPGFEDLLALDNFRYVEPDYRDYPAHYAAMSVFVSPSQLEGGPIPLLEAMMSNVVPVASRTGFAPDVIVHGRNGFLFDLPGDAADVCGLIDRAFDLEADVSSTVQAYSWDCFARRVGVLVGVAPEADSGPKAS